MNDGSTDETLEIIKRLSQEDARISIISLSRNFGHQAALTAGFDVSEGDVVISLDSDGQHPPELIPDMLKLYEAGYDIVLTQRVEGEKGLSFKKFASVAFYWLVNLIGDTEILAGAADFRLMNRKVMLALRQMPEYQRFIRGMIAWMGYQTVILPFYPKPRIAGKSKYSWQKMLKLASEAIFSFSIVPLRIGIGMGFLFLILAFLEIIYVLSFWINGQQDILAPGWSSLMFVILIVGGCVMILLGLIGHYIGFIFQEVKQRPKYLIRDIIKPYSEEPDFEEEEIY